ncbi:acyl-CoA dehydrogenase family protein [Methylocaldum szegediense]|uniref:Acyl-CoA dehydrogenase n=1 Tax=Methylocaldum szegediense TaxID=73780 RepID=A0ABN8X786_9GAMM|nr:acyl-CoA dehydrogenase family protein [Methylocaldum szegediense]CAI8870012.1 Acyl-CoA dehydrogenase [Methylocaldum szegediense]
MMLEPVRSPAAFLNLMLGPRPEATFLRDYASWWETEGRPISDAVDRAGTPWLRMFDEFGNRIDEMLYPPDYRRMLEHGYRAGAVWQAFEERSMLPAYELGYITAFHDPGLYCPYTVSLSTAAVLEKYGDSTLRERFLPLLLRQDDAVWQGATWMTEIGGGSDLGAAVATIAKPAGDRWRLTGDKYFASNVGAELAVVAARPEGAPSGVRGLALFLLPRRREDGSLNYFIRRLKDKIGTRSVPTGEVELRDSEGFLLGKAEWGIYLILEALNISRVANAIAGAALVQRALCDALRYAENRRAFGKPVVEHPLLRRQFERCWTDLQAAFALAWESVERLNEVWRETPPYSERYHLFRLMAHLAKYWTAELAVQTARWAMEVHGGIGTLAEQRVERWLREAMILLIWEGTSHRQILDGIEVMERKAAHRLLFDRLSPLTEPKERKAMLARVEALLARPQAEREALAEELFCDLAMFTAKALSRKHSNQTPDSR